MIKTMKKNKKGGTMKRLIVLIAVLIGCSGGGGGGGDDNGTEPVLNSVIIYKLTDGGWVESLVFEIGDEVNVDIIATDPDLDIKTLYYTEYYYNGVEFIESYNNNSLLPTQQEETGYYYFLNNLIVVGPYGSYRTCFFVVDGNGNESRDICLHTLVE
jgi:hypothetical protein